MSISVADTTAKKRGTGRLAGVSLAAGSTLWLALLVVGADDGQTTLVGLSIFGAAALALGAALSFSRPAARAVVLLDAAAAGAMLAAALVFVVPHALIAHSGQGGLGIALGLAFAGGLHYLSRGAIDRVALVGLTLHTLSAGITLGALYTLLPALGWTAGIAILAHKMPAGYLLARHLQSAGQSRTFVAWPALATGLGALPVAMIAREVAVPAGLTFGIAAGLFLFVAFGFLRISHRESRHDRAAWLAVIAGGLAVVIIGWGI